MSFTKFVKVQSESSGPFNNSSNKLIQFTLPDSMNAINGLDSYVELKTSVNCVQNAALGEDSTFLSGLWNVDAEGLSPYNGTSLIKNARLLTDKQGEVEDVQAVNVLRYNLDKYLNTDDERVCDVVFGDSYLQNKELQTRHSAFRQLVKNGDGLSSDKSVNLKIPLTRLFGLYGDDEMALNKTGSHHITLELEDLNTIASSLIVYDDHADPNASVACDNLAGGAANDQVIITPTFDDIDKVPFWTNQAIQVQRTTNAATGTVNCRITEIEWAADTGKVTLTLSADIKADGNATTAITIIELAPASTSYEITEASLVLAQLPNSSASGNEEVEFRTWKLERINRPAQNLYDKQVDLEPICNMVMIGEQRYGNGYDTLRFIGNGLQSYRHRLNGIDTTDRDVSTAVQSGIEFSSPLFYDRFIHGLESGGYRVDSLPNEYSVFVTEPIPKTASSQTLQIRRNANNPAASTMYVFKSLIRAI